MASFVAAIPDPLAGCQTRKVSVKIDGAVQSEAKLPGMTTSYSFESADGTLPSVVGQDAGSDGVFGPEYQCQTVEE